MKAVNKISSFILAGGESKRFGQDKSLYLFHGKPLIEYVIDALKTVFNDISIISNNGEKYSYLGIKTYPDKIPGLGPLGGIYTALKKTTEHRIFVVPCDMPFINPALIQYMISVPINYDVVVPFLENIHYQALHAIYSIKCIKPIEDLINQNRKKISDFYGNINIRKITEIEIIRCLNSIKDYEPEKTTDEVISKIFYNINHLDDIKHI